MAVNVNDLPIHPADRKLNIFVSHKMPADSTLAKRIGQKLALFGANRVVVRFAEQYPYGDNWREHIQKDINLSDMLIYLHTGEYEDWLYCLFECGMFVNRPSVEKDTMGITTFCKSMENVAAPLHEFNALLMSVDAVIKLYRQIYLEPPWAINPSLTDEDFKVPAADIAEEFMRSYYVIHNFDVTPGLVIDLAKKPETLAALKEAKLPDDAIISGVTEWQKLLGKDINTGSWKWSDLRDGWTYSPIYEYLLSKTLDRALHRSSTRAMLLRASNSSLQYRMALRRYEELSNERYRFHFTAGLVDLPFDAPTERAEKREVTLYHLINLTWFFRRKFVDNLYNRLLDLLAIPSDERMGAGELCEEIAYELMDIDAQALSRGVDNPRIVEDALGSDDVHTLEIMSHAKVWYDLRPEILEMIKMPAPDLEQVAKAVYQITMINYELYVATAEAFNRAAKALKPPPAVQASGTVKAKK